MKRLFATLMLMAGVLNAAPANYPLSINSRADTAPQITVYRSSAKTYALSFVDGATASDITGHTVWMSWSTNATAATVSTATCAVVSGTGGTATATFSATAMNYTPGRYVYEVGVTTGGQIRVYRQGVMLLLGSPYATGGSAAAWTTNHPWSLITGTPTTLSGYGITDALATNDSNYLAALIGLVAGANITITGSGRTRTIASTGGSGTSDHTALSNLLWTASGHTGTVARLAGFFEGAAAGYSGPGAGLYFDGSDLLAVSNDIITGAAAGTAAQEWGNHATNGYLTATATQGMDTVTATTNLLGEMAFIDDAPLAAVNEGYYVRKTNGWTELPVLVEAVPYSEPELFAMGGDQNWTSIYDEWTRLTTTVTLTNYFKIGGGTHSSGSNGMYIVTPLVFPATQTNWILVP